MQKYTYMIIDDEPLAREVIRHHAQNIEWLECVGEFGAAAPALTSIQSGGCDMVFLDITMPKINGVEFIKSLAHPPLFIFTTAYREYAVEAFELSAVDYLVKPFSFDRFLQAAMKAYQLLQARTPVSPRREKEFILIKSDTRFINVEIDSIVYIEAYREYVKIHTTDTTILSLTSMKNIADMLPAEMFFRIHRSYLISIQYLDMIQGYEAIVAGTTLPVSRDTRDELIEFLQKR